MPEFIPGKELSRQFFFEAVEPILAGSYPDLQVSAARIGPGSDVLGFDTEMSMDHDWGPRVHLFLRDEDLVEHIRPVGSAMRSALPTEFLGFPTFHAEHEDGTTFMAAGREGRPLVEITTFDRFLEEVLGFVPGPSPTPKQWLSVPSQSWLSTQAGAIFRDDLGIQARRAGFDYYPRGVWLYLLASQWSRVGEEEHLVARAGYVGDELGARLIASRLVRDLMRISFLMARQFAPYPKWFGSAFRRLPIARELGHLLEAVLAAKGWQNRQSALSQAFECAAREHNRLGLTEPIPEACGTFFGRPFQVIELTGGIAAKLLAQIEDPEVAEIAKRRPIGAIDTFSDSTDLLCDLTRRSAVENLY
ncbi:MAG TPA: DUF4037 domain-containing protein [Fimbriimonadaceae bacterium]|nr:DUF4037 domain-containing protein [Fimbriimonadaceae bacterium]